MTDITLTFGVPSSQSKVKLVDDPTQPGWDDVPHADDKDKKGKDKEQTQSR